MVDYFEYINEMEEQNIKLSQKQLLQDLQKYELSVNILTRTLNLIDKAFSVAEGARAVYLASFGFLQFG